jgi:ATP synthase protein I
VFLDFAVSKEAQLKTKKDTPLGVKQIAMYMTVPFILAVPPIFGWLVGEWLDEKFMTAGYLRYILLVMGVIAGLREFYRVLTAFGDDL